MIWIRAYKWSYIVTSLIVKTKLYALPKKRTGLFTSIGILVIGLYSVGISCLSLNTKSVWADWGVDIFNYDLDETLNGLT